MGMVEDIFMLFLYCGCGIVLIVIMYCIGYVCVFGVEDMFIGLYV